MGEFRRNPSKVWWASESVEWREVSSSPGSQDSGFSDTETSPPVGQEALVQPTAPPAIAKEDILKEHPATEKPQNLSVNYKEKSTPDKCIKTQLDGAASGGSRKGRYAKHSPKVSRNLFSTGRQKESTKDVIDVHQYSKGATPDTTHSSTSGEVTFNETYSLSDDGFRNLKTRSFVAAALHPGDGGSLLNKSAPAVLQAHCNEDDEEVTSHNGSNSLSSDCESELECLFNGTESPKHTSTPLSKLRHNKKKMPLNIYMKYQQERVPPIHTDNDAVRKWMDDVRHFYEQECMTTLQCKSIVGELNQKVAQMASCATINIRNVLTRAQCIEREYKHLNSEKRHVGPLAQSLAGNIVEFFRIFSSGAAAKVTKECDEIRKSHNQSDGGLKLVSGLFDIWQTTYQDILDKEAKILVGQLENPQSDLDLRSTLTGITSITLRHEILIDIFTKCQIIPILLILCEKCDGSSMRSLLLRALSTICCSTSAIRQFEKFSGIQIVADTLQGESRPEPERSEAVALLAQVTAPWIEDNHTINGLPDYSRRIVRALTKFAATTKCCQNLLLCVAALANLSTMDNKCNKYMLNLNTVQILLDGINRRGGGGGGGGRRASVYLLEQVATLIANMSAKEAARKQLTHANAPEALLGFLKITNANGMEEDVEKRLQQKSIIALSRLCGDYDAAKQVVGLGGVDKLVKMCREKSERCDSDAVLVATLATLRKIVDICGSDVINAADAQEFVQPKLLDSFLAYSTQSESYV